MLTAKFGFWGARLIALAFLILIAKPVWWFVMLNFDDNRKYEADPDPEKGKHI